MSTEHNIGRQGLGHENSGNRDKSNPFITEPVEQLPEYDHERAHPGHQIGETPDFVKTPEIPEQRTAEIVDNDTKNEKGSKKPLWITVGALATGAAIVSAALLGIKNNRKEIGAASPSYPSTPSSSAPAVAGSSSSAEVAPNPNSPLIKDHFTNETVPFYVNGEKIVGATALLEKKGIRIEDYPDVKEAIKVMISSGFTEMVNSGYSKEDRETFPDSLITKGNEDHGTGAAEVVFTTPGWLNVFFAKDASGEMIDNLKNQLTKIRLTNGTNKYWAEQDGLKYTETVFCDNIISNGPTGEGEGKPTHVALDFHRRDNGDKIPKIIENRTSEKADGSGPTSPDLNVNQKWNLVLKQEGGYWKIAKVLDRTNI